MSVNVTMPALSPTMEEGKLAKWHVKEGDTVSSGDVIAEIETDKATMEVEAVDEGTVSEILVPEGAEGVKVNTPIARLGNGASAGATEAKPPEEPRAIEAKAPEPEKAEIQTPAGGTGDPEKKPPEESRAIEVAPARELADPEIPAGTQMVRTTVRDALRDAMA